MMATAMPTDWAPPPRARRVAARFPRDRRARWERWADGEWWALRHGDDLTAGTPLLKHYRAASDWGRARGLEVSGHLDEPAGILYLRIRKP